MTEPAHHKRESRGSPRGFEPGQHRPISLLAGLVALVLADTAIAGDGVPELPRWSFGYDDQDRLGTIGTPEGVLPAAPRPRLPPRRAPPR